MCGHNKSYNEEGHLQLRTDDDDNDRENDIWWWTEAFHSWLLLAWWWWSKDSNVENGVEMMAGDDAHLHSDDNEREEKIQI